MKESNILFPWYGPPIGVRSCQTIQEWQDDGKKQGFQYNWLNDEVAIHY